MLPSPPKSTSHRRAKKKIVTSEPENSLDRSKTYLNQGKFHIYVGSNSLGEPDHEIPTNSNNTEQQNNANTFEIDFLNLNFNPQNTPPKAEPLHSSNASFSAVPPSLSDDPFSIFDNPAPSSSTDSSFLSPTFDIFSTDSAPFQSTSNHMENNMTDFDFFAPVSNHVSNSNIPPPQIKTVESSEINIDNFLSVTDSSLIDPNEPSPKAKEKKKKKKKSTRSATVSNVPDVTEVEIFEDVKGQTQISVKGTKPKTQDDLSVDVKEQVPEFVRIDSLPILRRGTPFLKYGRFGFPHFRHVQLSEDNLRIQWYSKGKTLRDTSIELRRINEIRLGQRTSVFQRHSAPKLQNASFSVIYDRSSRSLDIIARKPIEYYIWLNSLTELLRIAKNCTDFELSKLNSVSIDIPNPELLERKIINDGSTPSSYTNAPNNEMSMQVQQAYVDTRSLLLKAQKNSERDNVIISTQYSNIKDIIAECEDNLNQIPRLISTGNYKPADDQIWKIGVELESILHVIDCV